MQNMAIQKKSDTGIKDFLRTDKTKPTDNGESTKFEDVLSQMTGATKGKALKSEKENKAPTDDSTGSTPYNAPSELSKTELLGNITLSGDVPSAEIPTETSDLNTDSQVLPQLISPSILPYQTAQVVVTPISEQPQTVVSQVTEPQTYVDQVGVPQMLASQLEISQSEPPQETVLQTEVQQVSTSQSNKTSVTDTQNTSFASTVFKESENPNTSSLVIETTAFAEYAKQATPPKMENGKPQVNQNTPVSTGKSDSLGVADVKPQGQTFAGELQTTVSPQPPYGRLVNEAPLQNGFITPNNQVKQSAENTVSANEAVPVELGQEKATIQLEGLLDQKTLTKQNGAEKPLKNIIKTDSTVADSLMTRVYTGKENGITTAVNTETVVSQVTRSVMEMGKTENRNFTLELSPGELGKIKVKIEYLNGKMELKITAEQDVTAKVLTEQLAQLKTQFTANNVEVSNIEVHTANNFDLSFSNQSNSYHQTGDKSGENKHSGQYSDGFLTEEAEQNPPENTAVYFRQNQLLNYLI